LGPGNIHVQCTVSALNNLLKQRTLIKKSVSSAVKLVDRLHGYNLTKKLKEYKRTSLLFFSF
jgi:hypothetical protein